MKKEKGITLIALIITIIVLLILAGISIATLTGENGVLTKANEAKRQTEIEEAKEQAKLDIANWTAERIQEGKDSKLNDNIVKSILKGKDYVEGEPQETKFITKKGKHEILYSQLYTASKVEMISFTFVGDTITLPARLYLVFITYRLLSRRKPRKYFFYARRGKAVEMVYWRFFI